MEVTQNQLEHGEVKTIKPDNFYEPYNNIRLNHVNAYHLSLDIETERDLLNNN